MAYRDNVSKLAALRGISNNPSLQENDLGVGGLYFYHAESTMFTRIIGGRMNRGARLFFEHHSEMLGNKERWLISGTAFQELLAHGAEYFAELWEDVENRALLAAFKEANAVTIYWKSRPDWLKDFNRGCEEEMFPDF